MSWLFNKVSLYSSLTDTEGRPETLRNILLTEGPAQIETLLKIRNGAKELKQHLPLFSPSALLASRKTGQVQILEHTGIMQLDFDQTGIAGYDIADLKKMVFSLPFTALCSLSCSGTGFYALIAIKEPQYQPEYAESLFKTFAEAGIQPDTSKGRLAQDLRFLSYDANMLIRENPEPFKIRRYITTERKKPGRAGPQVNKIRQATKGNRFTVLRSAAFTAGKAGHDLSPLIDEINNNPAFAGEQRTFIRLAEKCFRDGEANR
jgi:hypothetical protein